MVQALNFANLPRQVDRVKVDAYNKEVRDRQRNQLKRRLEKIEEQKRMKEFAKKKDSSSENSDLDDEDRNYFKRTNKHFFKLMKFNEQ